MPIPAQLKQILSNFAEQAWEAWQTKMHLDSNERIIIDGKVIKIRIQARDPDYPKEILLRIKWRSVE